MEHLITETSKQTNKQTNKQTIINDNMKGGMPC